MSEDKRLDLPPPSAKNFSEKVREALSTYLGNRGNPLDRGVTLRDLVDAAVIKLRPGYTSGSGGGSSPVFGPGTAVEPAYEPDLTPPPTPTGFAVVAEITNLLIEHDAPLYTVGNGHGRTHIYGVIRNVGDPLPTFTSAQRITEFVGAVHSYPTSPSTTWHLWAKWVTRDGVESTLPAGGANGIAVTTAQNVALLLDALAGEITTDELATSLNTRIDLIDAPASVSGSVAFRVAAETLARTTAIAQEVVDRNAAIAAETQQRNTAIAQEVVDRNAAIAVETAARQAAVSSEAQARQSAITAEAEARARDLFAEQKLRTEQVNQSAQTLLEQTLALKTETDERGTAVALARFELGRDLVDGISAEATARLALATQVADNASAIVAEQTSRSTADSALAQDITTLFSQSGTNSAAIQSEVTTRTNADSALSASLATLTTTVAGNTAAITTEQTTRSTADTALSQSLATLTSTVSGNTSAIQSEATTRATADAVEAASRETLATQIRGNYAGADLGALTTGLLFQERITRASEDNALAQQITLLSAGAGEQFDWKAIWYFDSGLENWTGNGTPTAAAGYLRPANQTSGAFVASPVGVASDGNQYGQVRLRLRKVGTPTWAGFLYWRASADTTWDAARRVVLDEPTWDSVTGIGLVTSNPGWTVVVDRIRLDFSDAQSSTNYYELDWAAVGRPSPGASSAQLLAEQVTRAAADSAEASSRETLSSLVTGASNPTGLTLATLASGLLYEERQTRSTADTSLSSSITALQSTVTSNDSSQTAALTAEQTTRASADSAEVTARETLSSAVVGAVSPTGLTLGTLSSGLLFDERQTRATQDTALATSISTLSATVTGNYNTLNSAVTTEAAARATADSTEATAREALSSKLTGQADPSSLTLATLSSGLVFEEKQSRASADSALSSLVTGLQSSVGVLQADIVTEQTTRATADTAAATQLTDLVASNRRLSQADEDAANALLRGVLNSEAVRVNADLTLASARQELQTNIEDGLSAEAAARLELLAVVNANAAILTSEQTTRATADTALASSVTALEAVVNTNASTASAGLVTEQTTRANADTALSSSITALTATVATNASTASADLVTEQTTRATADTALSSSITALEAVVTTNASTASAGLVTEQTTRANADSALSSSITALTATVNSNAATSAAGLVTEQTTRASADTALSSSITALTATVNTNASTASAGLATEQTTRAAADTALSSSITALEAVVTTNASTASAGLATEQTTRADADTAISSTVTALTATVNSNAATSASGLATEQTARADADTAISSTVTALTATVNTNASTASAGLATEQTARANADSALSSSISTLSTTVGNNTTAISTNASSIDGVKAQYSVKIDNNGFVSGFGLASSLIDGNPPTSTFIANVDKFAVTTPSSSVINRAANTAYALGAVRGVAGNTDKVLVCKQAGTSAVSGTPAISGSIGTVLTDGTVQWQIASRVPFSVLTAPTTINSVSVPAGVYIDAGYILNATIQSAQIADLAVGTANIAAAAITTAKIGDAQITNAKIGGTIQSENYSAGTAGWAITKSNDFAEFGAASIRGQLTASQINTNGLTIKDGSGNVILSSGVPLKAANFGGTVGGGNLVAVGGFAHATAGGGLAGGWGGYGTNQTLSIGTSGGPIANGFYQRVSWTGSGNKGVYTSNQILSFAGIRGGAVIGRTYIFSFYAKCPNGTWPGTLGITFNTAPTIVAVSTPNLTTAWQRIIWKVTYTALPAFPSEFFIYVGATTSGTFDVANVQVEEGDIATAYSETMYGPITAANASTFIADAALGNAQIGGAISSTNYNPGVLGWSIDKGGSAEFNTGTFRGTMTVGTTPAVSGTTMTGSGGVLNSGGTFALGNATRNISFNGTTFTMNGDVIVTGNIVADAITKTVISRTVGTTTTTINASNTPVGTYTTTAQSASITTTGGKVVIWTSGVITASSQFSFAGTISLTVQVRRDATVVATIGSASATNNSETGSLEAVTVDISGIFDNTPAAGTYEYTITTVITISTYSGFNTLFRKTNGAICAIETKR